MRLHDLYEAILQPKQDWLDFTSWVVDQASAEYQDYLADNDDKDDFDVLADLMNDYIDGEYDIDVYAHHGPRKDPNEWVSAEAGMGEDGGVYINLILMADNMDGRWGPKSFKQVVMDTMQHETIHLNQYDRVGTDKIRKIKSGHQKGTELLAKGGTQTDWMREYLRDPHEIMAYANNLATELSELDNPQVALRRIEQYKQDLPTYNRYRSLFDKETKEIKMLLKYASQYIGN